MDYIQGSNAALTGINTVVRAGLDLGFSGNGQTVSWRDQLQPASYAGIPFGVFGGDGHFGRRNAVHEYPFRDSVWVEDMGRAARKINITGFLVGDDCIAQRDRLIKKCEQSVDGELVHSTLGRLKVSLISPVVITERWDHGRVFELSFSFVEAGQRIFPTSPISTNSEVGAKAGSADIAAGQDFKTRVLSPLMAGAAVVNQAVTTAATFYRKAQRLANDATNIMNLAKSLPGDFGRFSLGSLIACVSSVSTVPQAVGATSVNLGNLAAASASLNVAASNLSSSTAGDYGAVAQSVVAALLASSADPADSLRLLPSLADFTPAILSDTSLIGTSMNAMQAASADLFRRAAVVALARASAIYQPTSQEDALGVRTLVCGLLDNEITVAGDGGDDASYQALRDVRIAVVNDLNQRSAALPTLVTISSPIPQPALVLAMRQYRDVTRANELIMRAAPVHPAFMPTSFKALSV